MFRRLLNGNLGRNTAWMIVAQATRLVSQAIFFIILARVLNPGGFGVIASVTSVLSVLIPFSGWGGGNLLIMYTSRRPQDFSRRWGEALFLTVASGAVLLGVALGITRVVLPVEHIFVVACGLGFAELIFFKLSELSSQAFQAFEKLNQTAKIHIAISMFKLISVVIFAVSQPNPTPESWVCYYVLAASLCGVCSVLLASTALGRPQFRLTLQPKLLREGFLFSIGVSAKSVYTDIDKTILARYGAMEAVGGYGASYKVISASFAPIQALLAALYPQFFKNGQYGVYALKPLLRKFFPLVFGYGIVVSCALFIFAPVIPYLLGSGYEDSVQMIRWLALVPTIQSIHYLGADALTGSNHQGVRSVIQVLAAGINLVVNLWLIPAYGWKGAAVATLISETFLVVAIWTFIHYLSMVSENTLSKSIEKRGI